MGYLAFSNESFMEGLGLNNPLRIFSNRFPSQGPPPNNNIIEYLLIFDEIAKHKRVYAYIPLMNRQQYEGYRRNGHSLQHRQEVLKYFDELEKQGWRVIDLQNKSPDGIAVKDNKIVAVELLLKKNPKETYRGFKSREYSMFDQVLIKVVERKPVNCDKQGWENE